MEKKMPKNEDCIFKFPKILTITECGDLYKQLKIFANDKDEVVLDASEVEKVDTAGVQLVYSFVNSCVDEEKRSSNIRMSDNFKKAASRAGFSGW